MSGSDKESGVGDDSAEAEDEFSQVQVEDSSSYLEQLDSEVSHLVCCTYLPQFTEFIYMYIIHVR